MAELGPHVDQIHTCINNLIINSEILIKTGPDKYGYWVNIYLISP